MDLADILTAGIRDNTHLINQTGQRWPDRPIVLEMSWMPAMQKLDLVVKTIDHLPAMRFRPVAEHLDAATAGSDSASE